MHLSKPFLKRFTNLVVEMNCAQCLCVLTPLCLGDVRRVSRILLLLLSFSFEAFFQLHEKVEIKSSKENEIPISYLAPVLCSSKAESKVEESFFLASFALVTVEKRRTSRMKKDVRHGFSRDLAKSNFCAISWIVKRVFYFSCS